MEHKKHKRIETVLAVCFWLFVWQAASLAVGEELLLVSPFKAAATLASMLLLPDFWATVAFSSVRIVSGFLAALAAGAALALLAARVRFVRVLLQPMMVTVRSVPVASFIILALLWLKNAGNLAVLISFLMVLPIVYANVLAGIGHVDRRLLDMAAVFRFGRGKRLRYLYLPAVLPDFRAACSVGIGLCWKSGVAAEVIGITAGSIGERLYDAKLLFSTADLFAWTLVIVLLSLGFEKVFLFALDTMERRLLRVAPGDSGRTAPGRPETLVLEDITAGYGGEPVLEHLSLRVQAGQALCVMAPSGRGKTTLLHVLLRLLTPQMGRVLPGPQTFLAAAFQEDRLIGALSAADNLQLVTALERPALLALLADAGIGREAALRPADTLSGGQRRRVAVLRALLADGASAVVLDEPFKGLDPAAKARMVELVKRLLAGRALLAVTHDPQDAPDLGAAVFRL